MHTLVLVGVVAGVLALAGAHDAVFLAKEAVQEVVKVKAEVCHHPCAPSSISDRTSNLPSRSGD